MSEDFTEEFTPPELAEAAEVRRVARQAIKNQKAAGLLCACAGFLDQIKREWGDEWSAWDQSIRDGITEWLKDDTRPCDGGHEPSTKADSGKQNTMARRQGLGG